MIAAWASDEEDNKGGHDASAIKTNNNADDGLRKDDQIMPHEAYP